MKRPPFRSLRGRLFLSVVLGMVTLLIGSSALVYLLQEQALYERFDQTITSTAKAMAPWITFDRSQGVRFDLDGAAMPEFQKKKGSDYFQIWRADGTVLARSPTLGDADLARQAPRSKPVKYDCDLPRGQPGRAVLLTVELPRPTAPDRNDPPETITLVLAKESKPVLNDLRTLAWILTGTSLGGAVLAGALAWAVVVHGLRPLHRVLRQINQIGPSSLDQRIDPSDLPSELLPLAERLNAVLERLQTAFERERGFTSDAAHEFRNPLAAIRSVGEVALTAPQSPEEYRKDLAEIVTLSTTMQSLLETLLLLARLDARNVSVRIVPTDLSRALARILGSYVDRLAARHVALDNQCPPGFLVNADEDLLLLILGNLMENAAEYVNEGGCLAIHAAETETGAELTVRNTGCALTPQSMPCVFERFWRGDKSRSATGVHAGLGLSLVLRAAEVMGGTAAAALSDGQFTIRIQFSGAQSLRPTA
jgi:two-component system, OmpR family, heavy metal sensor histidine kinase CusS